ncbi:hypothetical protein CBM2592_U10003 [Cupriavidus taiwanensis]|nr:hypothetical protein CBM2592_U10003 [Cupriavidus taiwanensis]SOZ00964.1 hypothetical protein CBM2591_U10004 [Cupriavidus taiwanensis]
MQARDSHRALRLVMSSRREKWIIGRLLRLRGGAISGRNRPRTDSGSTLNGDFYFAMAARQWQEAVQRRAALP